MSSDLIFHIVSKRRWRECYKDGVYRPFVSEGEESEGIECVRIEKLNDHLNNHFKGRKKLFILVIDISRLPRRYLIDPDQESVIIGDDIQGDAILDKIRIDCGKEGQFDLSVISK